MDYDGICKCKAGVSDCHQCGSYQEYSSSLSRCTCISGYSNATGKCVKPPLCGNNEAWTYSNNSCICKLGYKRGAVGTPCT